MPHFCVTSHLGHHTSTFNFIISSATHSLHYPSTHPTFLQWCSGAGTHGNGVPTREILRDIFFIIAIKLAIFHCYHVTAFHASQAMSKLDIRISKALLH